MIAAAPGALPEPEDISDLDLRFRKQETGRDEAAGERGRRGDGYGPDFNPLVEPRSAELSFGYIPLRPVYP